MLALETTATIADHRLVIQDAALPAHAEHARVIVMCESTNSVGRRSPPPALAGMGKEKGDIVNGPPERDWEVCPDAHPRHSCPLLVGRTPDKLDQRQIA